MVILFLNKTSMGDKIACEKGCGELIPLTQMLFFYQISISQPNGFKFYVYKSSNNFCIISASVNYFEEAAILVISIKKRKQLARHTSSCIYRRALHSEQSKGVLGVCAMVVVQRNP